MNKPWIKEERRLVAIEHTEYMKTHFADDNKHSIENSKVYRNVVDDVEYSVDDENKMPEIMVVDMTTDKAIHTFGNGCCALNFASYKYPGGGFIIGATAQEEALCHVSNLYNVISAFDETEYAENRKDLKNGLYEDFAIYSPDIIFEENNRITRCNIITCPAPNRSATTASEFEIDKAMDNRIAFILDVAEANNQKTLILGAFGCGVFKNDPEYVAQSFKTWLDRKIYTFERIVFAIPSGPNLEAFKNVFE